MIVRKTVVSMLVACSLVALVGCTSTPRPVAIDELNELQSMSIRSLDDAIAEASSEGSRLRAIEQVATATGIRSGRRWRQNRINEWLQGRGDYLASVWNFEQLMIDGLYLPPRVDEVKGHVEELPDGGVRFVRQAYRIASRPKLVATPPTYLNYLFQVPDEIEPPNPLGLPQKGTREVEVWRKGVADGWVIGVRQADMEFDQDLNLLKRDFSGMLRYLDLVARGLITMPKLASEEFGIVVSADGKSLNVGDEVVTIARDPNFQHSAKWKTLGEGL